MWGLRGLTEGFFWGGSLTGGGCPPAWLAARWLLDKGLLLWAALELTDTGASPSSAMRDRYSLSILALS